MELQLREILEKKWNKILILLLIVSASLFAVSQSATDNNQRLYRINSASSSMYIESDIRYTHSMALTSSGRVLESDDNIYSDGVENGDVICPGVVTVTDTISGQWAYSGDFSTNEISLPGAYEDSCWPIPDEDDISSNRPISWSRTNYNGFINRESCWSDEACWGDEGSRTDQAVEYDTVYGVYPDKKGSLAFVCKARDDLIVKRGGTTISNPAATNYDTNTLSYTTPSLSASATDYRFESETDITGCVAIIRYPSCPDFNVENIFGRTSAQNNDDAPEYSFTTITKNTLDVTVANRQQSLQVLYTIPDSGSTVEIPPGGSQIVIIQVRNNGDVTNRVTGVSANNGFTTTPTSCPTGSPGDGINENMAVNAEERVCFILTAPSYSGTTSTRISLTYEALARTCSATSPDVKTFNVTFSSIEEGETGPTCVIPEDGVSLQQDDTFRFNLNCADQNGTAILCANTLWTLAGVAADVVEDEDDHLTLTITSSSGTGTLNANVSSSFACDATFTVGDDTVDPCPTPPCPPGIDNGCTLSPGTTYVHPDEINGFNIICPNNLNDQCNSVIWSINPTFSSVESSDNSFALVRSGNNVGSGILEARTDDGANFCTANITISEAICADFI